MTYSARSFVIVMLIAGVGLLFATRATAGVNVNESGNAVLCKGKSCTWLKPACKQEGGKYTEGAGGTGKCNFRSEGKFRFSAVPRNDEQANRQKLRNVAPDRGRLVPRNQQFKVKRPGGAEVVCCTHWNTAKGGTGCAIYADSCPDDAFTVECGRTGCW